MLELETSFRYFAASYCHKLVAALMGLDSHEMFRAVQAIQECKGTVRLIGNGGSAALASHMATDLQLAGVKAMALTDVAAITTYANDRDYSFSFRAQLEVLWRDGDVLIAISGSGNSPNIMEAVYYVTNYSKGTVIMVVGFTGGQLGKWEPAIVLHVPAQHMGMSQDGHQIILHIICYYLMEKRKHDEEVSTTGRCSCGADNCTKGRRRSERMDRRLDGQHDNLGPRLL